VIFNRSKIQGACRGFIAYALNNASPRIQLAFIAILVKLIGVSFIGLAYIFNYQPLTIVTSMLLLVWLGVMFAIAIPQTDVFLAARRRWLKKAWHVSIVILSIVVIAEILVLTVVHTSSNNDNILSSSTKDSIKHAFADSDATMLIKQATENVLDGKNPYVHADTISAIMRYNSDNSPWNKITPIRTGQFADAFPYPTEAQLQLVWQDAVASTAGQPTPEIESRLNYPAASFLLLTPFRALGIDNLGIALLIIIIPVLVCAAMSMQPQQRIYFILYILFAFELWNTLLSGDVRMLYLPFVLAGWLMAPRRPWLSAIFIGIAVATRQNCWFLLPFYLIYIWQTAGSRTALRSGAITAATFLGINAPFIIAAPQVYLSSVLAPLTANFFPMGNGLISLVTSGIIHLDSLVLFSVMEIVILVGCVLWYKRYAKRYPHTGIILAVIPLFFAWRSLLGYFYIVDIVLIAAILSQQRNSTAKALPAAYDETHALVPSTYP